MAHSNDDARATSWLQVFNNSKVNGAPYEGEKLPAQLWCWPTDTYLQRRLREVRAQDGEAEPCPCCGAEVPNTHKRLFH